MAREAAVEANSFYGLIGNGETVALVSPRGAIDWLCAPRADAPFVFGRLIDPDSGFCDVALPGADVRTWRQAYLPGTAVLETAAHGHQGERLLRVVDFMPRGRREMRRTFDPAAPGMPVHVRILPTFDYRRATHAWTRDSLLLDGKPFLRFQAHTQQQSLCVLLLEDALESAAEFPGPRACGPGLRLNIKLEAATEIILVYSDACAPHLPDTDAAGVLAAECAQWKTWLQGVPYTGAHRETFERSLITMKLLTYAPTGANLAAATTSIPQHPGSGSNWDYRFCWVRDGAYTASAWAHAGCAHEARTALDFFFSCMAPVGKPWQPVYRISGDPDCSESVLRHLAGFHGDGPVRIGNLAFSQKQNDLEGEVLGALWDYYERTSDRAFLDYHWPSIFRAAEYTAAHWRDTDNGIWELRGVLGHFTHSKVMCWCALDRAARVAAVLHREDRAAAWRAAADAVRSDVLRRGWNRRMKSFTMAYGVPLCDSALLAAPLCGLVDPAGAHARDFMARVEKELTYQSLTARNIFETAPFPLVTYWLAQAHLAAGNARRAREIVDRTLRLTTDLGLFCEHVLSAQDQPKPAPDTYLRSARDLATAHESLKDAAAMLTLFRDFYKHRNTFKEKTNTPRLTRAQKYQFRGNFPQLYSHEELVKTLVLIEDAEKKSGGGSSVS
jgi:GH15 family glucan-1,4-alpha-glucosidase